MNDNKNLGVEPIGYYQGSDPTFIQRGIDLTRLIPGSKYFKWGEALYLPKVKAYALPDKFQIENIQRLAQALDKVRVHFGRPINITSWLRPVEYNKLIGGAPNSYHIKGLAVDFVIPGLSHEQVKSDLMLRPNVWPGRGEINTTNWIHLDLGPGEWFRV